MRIATIFIIHLLLSTTISSNFPVYRDFHKESSGELYSKVVNHRLSSADELVYTYQLDSQISARAVYADGVATAVHEVNIHLSAIVTNYETNPYNKNIVHQFSLIITDHYHDSSEYVDPCNQTRKTFNDFEIVDPVKYATGPTASPFFTGRTHRFEYPVGTTIMKAPLDNALSGIEYTYKISGYEEPWCGHAPYTSTGQALSREFVGGLMKGNNGIDELIGDSTGKLFVKNVEFDQYIPSDLAPFKVVSSPMLAHIHANTTFKILDNCTPVDNTASSNTTPLGSYTTPSIPSISIQANKDTIPPNKGDTYLPPDPSKLTIKVLSSCGGAPLGNISLRVSVIAQENSGGHQHSEATVPRPRGYLNLVKITQDRPYITIQTNALGVATVEFLPGRDLPSGNVASSNCTGDQRGIAGTYKITVIPADSQQGNLAPVEKKIEVKRTDFVSLPSSKFIKLNPDARHPNDHYGTSDTIKAIQALASDFYEEQLDHNEELDLLGEPEWVTATLPIDDMSLVGGGLFDSGGTNLCQGDKQNPFSAWRFPHQGHWNGKVADFKTSLWGKQGFDSDQIQWLKSTLVSLGCSTYGHWVKEKRSFHLAFDTDNKSCNFNPAGSEPAGMIDMVSQQHESSTNADLTLTVLSDSDDSTSIAAGQIATFTLGVDNRLGGDAIHDTTVKVLLPTGLSFVSSNPELVQTNGGVLTWELGTMSAGQTPKILRMTVMVNPDVSVGTILTFTATTSGAETEANLNNNNNSGVVIVDPAGSDLIVESDLDYVALTVSQPTTVTVSVRNVGNQIANDTVLTFTLPTSVILRSTQPGIISSGSGFVVWKPGNIIPGATYSSTAVLALDPLLLPTGDLDAGSVLTFTAHADSKSLDLDNENNLSTVAKRIVEDGSDTAIWLSHEGDSDSRLDATNNMTYTIHFANYGNQVASGTIIRLTLGSDLNLLNAQPVPEQVDSSSNSYQWVIGNLDMGEDGVIVAHIHVSGPGVAETYTSETITSDDYDIDPTNNGVINYFSSISGGTTNNLLFLPLVRR